MKETVNPEIETYSDGSPQAEEEVYIFPATFAQKRFWFLDQFEPGSPYYNIPTAFRLRGSFNSDIFKMAIDEIVLRHEILRTTFDNSDGEPVQVVSPPKRMTIPIIDLSDKSADLREKEIRRLATEEARRPFFLDRGPLLRITIIKAADSDHIILLTMHHIISDGWSMGVMVNEITILYGAFLLDQPSPLEDLPIQYGDFAEWQKEYLQGDLLKKQLEYWKNHLGSHPPVLELPYDRPRPQIWSNVGSSISTTISKEITERLNNLSRGEGATLFMTLLSAFKILLYRYSGHTNICIGTPIANRTRVEIERLIGLFINTLVIRTQFENNPTFREMLKYVRTSTLSAYENQDLPFEYLVDALQPDRDMTYPPLFQVMFILQNAPVNIQTISSDLTMEMLDVDMGTSTFDMTLAIAESPVGLSAAIEYNTDLFDRRTIEQFLNHYKNLLSAIVSQPDQKISFLPIMSRTEENRILYDWNDSIRPRERGICIHQLFERRAQEKPQETAVICREDSITYNELNRKANQLANYLKHFHIGPEIKVAILAEKSVELMVALLGVLKSGGAYLPLDPDYPTERLQYMLEDAQVPLLITQKKYESLIREYRGQIIRMDSDWNNIAGESINNPIRNIQENNLAYLIYTSGSTGKSKGTMVTHRSLVNAYFAWEEAYELRTMVHGHLQMASFSFDVFSGDWTRALCSGGKLVLVPRDMLLEAEELYQYMSREKVDIAEFVPAVLRNLIQYLEQGGQKLDFFRNLIAGSDIWYVGEYQKFQKFIGSGTRLINSFGLTEATIDSTYFESKTLNLPAERLVPIGRPFNNMSIYILDEYYQPVASGVRGELFVGGEGVARGYWKRSDLTAERFIPNPFSRKAGEILYRTGDLARYLPDGNIEFLGRADTQVKLRGFRIELGEIETTLANHPEIKDAAVTLREDIPGDKRLVAYYVPKKEKEPSSSILKEFLAQHLPDYMVPSAFIWLDELPLTPNGKVDRRALPRPDQNLYLKDLEEEYVAPRTPTEEVIAAVFGQILNLEKISAFHNFFILGGHSLLATQLISRLRDNFKTEIPLRSIFENPTVAGLAIAVDKAKLRTSALQPPPILAVSRDQELPLSFAQQRLWFLDQLEPNSPFYNIPETYMIEGPLKTDLLERSINEVIRRHEALRTTFHKIEGAPAQTIHGSFAVKLKIRDLSGLPESEKGVEALQIARQSALTPISISELPLFNLEILKITENEHAIILIIHHIISDNWSTQIMMSEISLIYDAFSRGEPSPLPELPIQYPDFAYWQRNWLQGAVLEEQINYWKNQLRGSPPLLALPTDRPRPVMQTYNGSYRTFYLGEKASQGIRDIAKQSGATVFMTLLAAFKTLLFRYSGQEDINIGTPIANRNRSEIEGLIGFFVNTLVLRTDLSGNPAFIDLLKRIREIALAAYAHQDLPFEKIVDALQPERNLSHSPLFQVMFALQSSQAQTAMHRRHSELTIKPIEAHSGTAKFDLTLFMIEDPVQFSGALEFNTNLFDNSTIDRMVDHFKNLIENIVADPSQSISALPMIDAEEKKKMIANWAGQRKPWFLNRNIIEIFNKQVEEHPHHIALEYETIRLTYQELNIKVNQLAHYLMTRGVKPDQMVGIFLKRSVDLMVSILAVLKAGGAYVPIDPTYPEERLAFILTDSKISLLLSHSTLCDLLPPNNVQTLLLDREFSKFKSQKKTNPTVEFYPDHLAYMIYTSGSTGQPKGTMITHRGLSNYLGWCSEAYPLEKGRGSLVHSTIAFDATVTALFSPILTAKTITLLPDEDDLEALGKALLNYKDFSVIKITPAHLDLLSHQITRPQAANLTHAFVIGGENLTSDQIQFWQNQAPQTLLFNEYGPTETVVGCIVYEALHWREKGSVPIGKSIPNTTAYLLDQNLEIVPTGVPGELYLGGQGLARGYLNRPDLTAERFVPDPFSQEPGARLYRTGDLVRYLANGQMEFLGRIDAQVKIRGYRIELGEIETVLADFPDIEEAVVLVREDAPGDKRLAAYFVSKNQKDISSSELKEFLKKQLPEYMIPNFFVRLQALPLTPNGKVDRKALPKPAYSRDEIEIQYIAPQTTNEKKLATIWQDILKIEKIGIHDNFFELGGHSLLATQVISRIRDSFDIELPLRYLFEFPNISALVRMIEERQKAGEKHLAKPITKINRKAPLPLSFAQQRLWFLDQLTPNSPFYNIPMALRISGDLDPVVLEKVIATIINRHESLRTIFYSEHGQPFQFIKEDIDFKLEINDLSELSPVEKKKETFRLIAKNASEPFNLSKGTLFRSKLIKLAEKEYVILFTMHHIISDGWSTNVLMQEVAALYDAFTHNRPSPLPDLEIQYVDYAAWQRSWLKDDVLAQQLEYWKSQIGLNPPLIDLPLDYPRPAIQTFNGDTLKFQINKKVSDALRKLGQQEDCTLFMTLLAAFQSFLYRYSNQDEIFIGTPIANRTQSETEALIGFFVNTLVIKGDFSESPSFKHFLGQIRESTLGAYAHQDLPFEYLVDELQPLRATSHSPLFQVMFVLQNAPAAATHLPSLRLEVLEAESKTAKFDLTLMILDHEQGFMAEFEYNTDLFRSSTIQRMKHQFITLLERIITQPAKSIAQLSLISKEEERLIIHEWNRTKVPFPNQTSIQQLFEQRVIKTPGATAVRFGDAHLSFLELNQKANQLAHFLSNKGLQTEDFIGISLERSLEMVIALLGVLKAGGVYVPIDPAYPSERINYIIENAGIKFLLTQQVLADQFEHSDIEKIFVDSDRLVLENEAITNPDLRIEPENLAYMIYTSGSTGKPKGTMLQHRSLCNLTMAQIKDFNLKEGDRCLQFASFSFDASVSEIFTTLISGATLYLAQRDQLLPGPGLIKLLKQNEITTITLPPSVTSLLKGEQFPALKTIISAGENCRRDIAEYWHKGRRFLNAYGPTENTVCACSYHLTDLTDLAKIPIGRPIDNVQLYVLDNHYNLLPIGIPGELCIGGVNLARGYFKQAVLTAEKFIPNPFSDETGSRLYRTGDRARFLADGNIEFLGRIDEQVKIRGFRIELGEIENVLNQQPGIDGSVVVDREDTPGDIRLIAYYIEKPDMETTFEELRRGLKTQLPDYMIPSAFMKIESIPLTPNGKVNRRLLPKPEHFRSDIGHLYTAPRNPEEEQLVEIWQQLLHLKRIGITDNFFDLGGHSLLATQLVSRIRDKFQLEIPLIALFENPTISALALEIEKKRLTEIGRKVPEITRADRSMPISLSFAQQRLWFLDQLAPDNPAYNLPTAIRLQGALNYEAFEKSLNKIIQRHESLRTTFTSINGNPLQIITPELPLDVDMIDLKNLPKKQREDELKRLVLEDSIEPFDLEVGPLFRTRIIKLAEDDQAIIFNMHHIISDGWSMGILIREFAALYESFSTRGFEAVLSELPIQYADFAIWQRNWLSGEMIEEQIQYWKNKIGLDPAPLNLPTDHPRPAIQTFQGSSEFQIYSKEILEKIKNLSQKRGVTLFMLLTAAFQTLLHRYSNQDEILIGTPIANRTQSELENLIGFFVNNLVLKTDFSDQPDFLTLLDRVKQTTLEAYANQDLPFEQLVEILHPERDMSHSPVFQVAFVMQNTPMESMDLSEIKIEALEAEQKIAKFDLTLIMMESPEGLYAEFEYNTDLFEQSTIQRILLHFEHLLGEIVNQPEKKVAYFSLLPQKDTSQILNTWNRTEAPYPSSLCVHQIFEQQVATSLNKTAILAEDKQISYRELNRRANQLAHYLRSLGIGPDKIVGISIDRSIEMIIAILGVLKAGGAYLPIDPNYPGERINYLLENSGIPILLTQKSLHTRFKTKAIRIIHLDTSWKEISKFPTDNPDNLSLPENLAYVIYTSGSTGLPKGTLLQHRGLCNLTKVLSQIFKVDSKSRSLQFAAFGFDASVEEIFTPLTVGGTLVLIPQEKLISGTGLIEVLNTKKVTNVTLPPSVLTILMENDFPNLRSIVSAGEACSPEIANYWSRNRHFVNGYGPTENTVCSTAFTVKQSIIGSKVPIGKPVPNTQTYILDKNFNPVPIGVPGELYLGGVALARGYLNRPDLTADKFLPNPFSPEPGARMYRTGDLARYSQDGNIEFLGRLDEQIKIRGFRVELGEIESVIAQNQAIKDVLVTTKKSPAGTPVLIAYLIVRDKKSFKIGQLKQTIKQKLTDYMMPAAYVILDAFPLTPNGKIDYRSLPEPELIRADSAKEVIQPRNRTEARLKEIWERVLKVKTIGVKASFFDLGGHSLLAMKLLTEIEKELKKDINLIDFFKEPTIEHMAQLISGETSSKSTMQLIQLKKGTDSPAIFFVHPSGGGVHHYAELAGLLQTEKAFYAIQAKGLDGKEKLHKSIEEMAAAYIDLILTKQPEGPYIIGSWSLGVIIAHEMACQLSEMGKEMGLVLQFDQGPYIERLKPKDNAEMLTNMFIRYFRLDTEYLRSLDEDSQFKFAIKKAKKHKVIPKFVRLADFKRYIIVNETQIQAWLNYQPQKYPGKITLLRSEENKDNQEQSLGWQNLVNEIEIIDVPGNHITMIQKPQVQILASKLSELVTTL